MADFEVRDEDNVLQSLGKLDQLVCKSKRFAVFSEEELLPVRSSGKPKEPIL